MWTVGNGAFCYTKVSLIDSPPCFIEFYRYILRKLKFLLNEVIFLIREIIFPAIGDKNSCFEQLI